LKGGIALHLIHPTEVDIRPYIGKKVCAIAFDESCFYGVIDGVRDGMLVLKGQAAPITVSSNVKTAKSQLKKASTSAFFSPFAFNNFLIPLTLLSLLFIEPFFFGSPFFF
jgi:hypothetical protein